MVTMHALTRVTERRLRPSRRAAWLAAGAAVVLLASTTSAVAATATDTFTVTATVSADCTIDATDLNFGTYVAISASNVDGTTTISVTCTLNSTYEVGLNAGTGTGATVTTRKLTSGANTLNYSLYQNVGRTTVWGNTVGSNEVTGTGSGLAQTLTVYGRIPGSQNVPAGTYTDTVTATVNY